MKRKMPEVVRGSGKVLRVVGRKRADAEELKSVLARRDHQGARQGTADSQDRPQSHRHCGGGLLSHRECASRTVHHRHPYGNFESPWSANRDEGSVAEETGRLTAILKRSKSWFDGGLAIESRAGAKAGFQPNPYSLGYPAMLLPESR